jgi:hypothetical protein
MNRDPWSITYRIIANKQKTSNIISPIKKADGFTIVSWQETADESIKNLFLEDLEDEAIVADRMPIEEENAIEVYEIKGYIDTLKSNTTSSPDGIKAEIYKQTSDITI